MAIALAVAFAINLSVVATNSSSFFSRACAEADDGPYACLSPSAYQLVNGDPPRPRPLEGLGASCVVTGSGESSGGEGGGGEGGGALHGHCGEIGLENAGLALADTLGSKALLIWALGLLAAGQASTMVCTYAGQIIMGGLLAIQLPPWKRVAITRIIAIGPALAVALYATSQPGALNAVNEFLNIMQSVLLPFAMLPVLHFAAAPRLMGRFRSPPLMLALSTFLALVVLATNGLLLDGVISALGPSPAVFVAVGLGGILYSLVCLRMVWGDLEACTSRLVRVLGSCGTILRYKIEDCFWALCGDAPADPAAGQGGAAHRSGRQPKPYPSRVTEGLLDADATIEGELLGRLLTPESLAQAARASRGGNGNGGGGGGRRQPRNLMGSYGGSRSSGSSSGSQQSSQQSSRGSYAPPKTDGTNVAPGRGH